MFPHALLMLFAVSLLAVTASSPPTAATNAVPLTDDMVRDEQALAALLEEEMERSKAEVKMLSSLIAEQEVQLAEVEQSCSGPVQLGNVEPGVDAGSRRLPDMPVYMSTTPGPVVSTNSSLPPQTSSEETMWFVLSGTAATLMQVGFVCIETGSLPEEQAPAAALRGLVGVSTSGVAWWLFGYGFAFGGPYDSHGRLENGVIGTRRFAGSDFTTIWRGGESGTASGKPLQMIQPTGVAGSWFMEWGLCAACVAIICGGCAERVGITAHAIIAFLFAGFVYPFAVAQLKGQGFLARMVGDEVAVVDFAGSGFVHLVGGMSAFIACWLCGPRVERFDENHTERRKLLPGNTPLITIGTLLYWCGWNGVVAGASRKLRDRMSAELAAQALVNSTVGGAAGGLVVFFLRASVTMVTRHAITGARIKMKDTLAEERSFQIQVDRSHDGALPLGVVVDHLDKKTLHISAIGADGAIGAWNDENPDKQVGIGDKIVDVNDVTGDSQLLAYECKKREILKIRIRPHIPDLPKSAFTLSVEENTGGDSSRASGFGVGSTNSMNSMGSAPSDASAAGKSSRSSRKSGAKRQVSQRRSARQSAPGMGSRLSISADLVMDYTPEWSWHLVFAERGINASVVSAGIRAGLVAVAAGAGSMYTGNALMTGVVAGFLCEFTAIMSIFCKLDDPIDALGAHGVAGFWGLIAAGLMDFGSEGGGGDGLFHGINGWSCTSDALGNCLQGVRGDGILTQFLAALVLTLIVFVLGAIIFGTLHCAGILRTRNDGEAHQPENVDEPVVEPPWKAAARAARDAGSPRPTNEELSRAAARHAAQTHSGASANQPTNSQQSDFQIVQASQGVPAASFSPQEGAAAPNPAPLAITNA